MHSLFHIFVISLFFFSSFSSHAETYKSLHGFELGEPIEHVLKKLGQPDKVIELPSKSVVRVFFRDQYYFAFVTLPPDNNFIYSIQLTGDNSSITTGIGYLHLNDDFEKVVTEFRKPSRSQKAIDQETGKDVANTYTHFYDENFSIETVDNKVTSIKLQYDGTLSSDNAADEKVMALQPPELIKVRDHILNHDYPELFNDKAYRISINGFGITDIGNDSLKEVVLLYHPHYLQSPTIVIYQIQKDGSVKRLTEALAPGPLVKRGEYFLDSHSLGQGVDFTIEIDEGDSHDTHKIVNSVSKNSGFGLLVQYKSFFHADNRKGDMTYIDMSHLDPTLMFGPKNCSKFEFSKIEAIRVGQKKGQPETAIISAIIKNKAYIYEIFAITDDGFLNKKLTVYDLKNQGQN